MRPWGSPKGSKFPHSRCNSGLSHQSPHTVGSPTNLDTKHPIHQTTMAAMKLDGTGVAELPTTDSTVTTVAVTSTRELALGSSSTNTGAAEEHGEWGSTDIKLPYFNLVQATSKSPLREFGFGSFVFDKSVKVGDEKTPATAVVLRMKRGYVQLLPQTSTEMPQQFSSLADVRAAGMQPGNVRDGRHVGDQAWFQLAIAAPEGTPEELLARFPYECEGKQWAMGVYIVQSTAFGSFAKVINTLRQPGGPIHGDGPFGSGAEHKGLLEIHFAIKAGSPGKSDYAVPTPVFKGLNSPEAIEFFATLKGE